LHSQYKEDDVRIVDKGGLYIPARASNPVTYHRPGEIGPEAFYTSNALGPNNDGKIPSVNRKDFLTPGTTNTTAWFKPVENLLVNNGWEGPGVQQRYSVIIRTDIAFDYNIDHFAIPTYEKTAAGIWIATFPPIKTNYLTYKGTDPD